MEPARYLSTYAPSGRFGPRGGTWVRNMYSDHTVLETAGQIILAVFFILHGVKNVAKWRFNVDRTAALGIPLPAACLIVGFIIQFSGALLVLFDAYTRLGAVLLIVFTVMSTAMFQRFWSMSDPVRAEYHFLLFTYNICLIGALFLIM